MGIWNVCGRTGMPRLFISNRVIADGEGIKTLFGGFYVRGWFVGRIRKYVESFR